MSIRYINSNDLINDVPDYLQNIINNMDCVYIDGIKPNNQHFNLAEHDKQIRAEALLKFSKRLLDYDTQITKEDIIDELCFFIDRDDVEKWLKEQK